MANKKIEPIEMKISNRLAMMISMGCSIEKQQSFISDACLFNKAAKAKIMLAIKSINPNLIVTKHPSDVIKRRQQAAQSIPERAIQLAKAELQALHDAGNQFAALRYGVGLSASLRNVVFSKSEVEKIILIKSTALKASEVMRHLSCTLMQLNKLDSLELRHSFTKVLVIKGSKVKARYWLLDDVLFYKQHSHLT